MSKELEERTKRFSLAAIRFCSTVRHGRTEDVLVRQLIRAATSIGSNYREANRAVSRADFRNKIGIVQKEAAETQYWIELINESDRAQPTLLAPICIASRPSWWQSLRASARN